MRDEYRVRLDPRSAGLRTARPEILQSASQQWPTGEAAPRPVADLLRVSRELFVHAAFAYDFFTVGVAWSLLAVEGALRERLPGTSRWHGLGRLVERAESEQLIGSDDAKRLKAGAVFRNQLLHPLGQVALTPGIAEGILRASHEAVAKLYT